MNFVPDIEFQSKEDIKAFQEQKMQEQLAYLQAHSPFYQKLFSAYNIDINKIKIMCTITFCSKSFFKSFFRIEWNDLKDSIFKEIQIFFTSNLKENSTFKDDIYENLKEKVVGVPYYKPIDDILYCKRILKILINYRYEEAVGLLDQFLIHWFHYYFV